MAHMPAPPGIVMLEGRRCIVIPADEGAEFTADVPPRVLRFTSGCIFTENGYEVGGRPLWPGAVSERIHPWPPY